MEENTRMNRDGGGGRLDSSEDQGVSREDGGDGGGERDRCWCNRTVMPVCPLHVVYQVDLDDSGLYCGQHVK